MICHFCNSDINNNLMYCSFCEYENNQYTYYIEYSHGLYIHRRFLYKNYFTYIIYVPSKYIFNMEITIIKNNTDFKSITDCLDYFSDLNRFNKIISRMTIDKSEVNATNEILKVNKVLLLNNIL